MRRAILIIALVLVSVGLSDTDYVRQEEIKKFKERKGRVYTLPIHTTVTPEGASSSGKKGTWDYDSGYLYIWITDELVMRVALETFGKARIRTVEGDLPIQTVAGENLRAVGDY